jgi:hypothetical protein
MCRVVIDCYGSSAHFLHIPPTFSTGQISASLGGIPMERFQSSSTIATEEDTFQVGGGIYCSGFGSLGNLDYEGLMSLFNLFCG